jgi:hypothetical protein
MAADRAMWVLGNAAVAAAKSGAIETATDLTPELTAAGRDEAASQGGQLG